MPAGLRSRADLGQPARRARAARRAGADHPLGERRGPAPRARSRRRSSSSRIHSLPSGRPQKPRSACARPTRSRRGRRPACRSSPPAPRPPRARRRARPSASRSVIVCARGLDRVVGARLERQGPLARRRRQLLGLELEGDLLLAPEPAQPGGGQHEPVEVAVREPPQAGVDVAAQLDQLEVGPQRQQLGAAAQARGPDAGALGDLLERAAAPTKASRGSSRAGTPAISSPSGSSVGRSLAECTARSTSPVQQRLLDLAHEARLVAAGEPASRSSPEVLIGTSSAPPSAVGDQLGLGERQGAAARAEPQRPPAHARVV